MNLVARDRRFSFSGARQDSHGWGNVGAAGSLAYILFRTQSRQLFGHSHVDELIERYAFALRNAPGLIEPLSDRELEVLRLLAAGRSNQQIARDLFVALDTVKKHVTHVLGKLGAANRTEAAARARQVGLIP